MLLTAKQSKALEVLVEYKNILLYGGSRSGKTSVIMYYIISRCLLFAGSWHLMARRYETDVRMSLWDERSIFKILPLMGLKEGKHFTHTDKPMEITFSNGSHILASGLDDDLRVDKILGQEYATQYVNESHDIPYRTIEHIGTRLSQLIPWMDRKLITDLNPGSTAHWTHRLWFEQVHPLTREPIDTTDYSFLQMNPADNLGNIDQQYIDERLKKLQGDEYKRFFLGEYQANTDLRVFVPTGYYKWDEFAKWAQGKDLRLVGGLDLGFQDADAFVLVAYVDECEDTWVLYEHKARRQDIAELADSMKKGIEHIREALPLMQTNQLAIYADTNTIRSGLEGDQKKNWRLLNEVYGLSCRAARKTGKALSIEILREDINAGRCHILRGGSLDDEADQTVWTKNPATGEIERIIDDEVYHPDSFHALRYAYNYLTSPQGNSAMIGREKAPGEPEYIPQAIKQIEMIERKKEENEATQIVANMLYYTEEW